MRRCRYAIAVLTLALAGCHPPRLSLTPTPQPVAIHLLSTDSTAPLVRDLAAGYQQDHPAMRFVFRLSASNYENLIATVSNPTPDGPLFGVTNYLPLESSLWAAPIAQDPIAVVVHPSNPLTELALAQLQAIYQGRIVDWAALGQGTGPITVVSREDGSDVRLAFQALALGDRRVTLNARLAPSSQAVIEIVGQERGAIGYLSLGLVDATVRPLAIEGHLPAPGPPTAYPFRTPVFVVGSQEPQGVYRAFIAWMQSPAGQAVVARRYQTLPQ